jgi:hypothetical protein
MGSGIGRSRADPSDLSASSSGAAGDKAAQTRFRKLLPHELAEMAPDACNIIVQARGRAVPATARPTARPGARGQGMRPVMAASAGRPPSEKTAHRRARICPPAQEYCDRGTLASALRSGSFHARLEGGVLGVDLGSVLEVLLDVASALRYLHSMKLVRRAAACAARRLRPGAGAGLGRAASRGARNVEVPAGHRRRLGRLARAYAGGPTARTKPALCPARPMLPLDPSPRFTAT